MISYKKGLKLVALCSLLVSSAWAVCEGDSGDTTGTIDLPGKCPNITYLKNLDLFSTAGAWYRRYGTLNLLDVGCDGDCITEYIVRLDDNTVFDDICCRKGCETVCGTELGSGALLINPDDSGRIDYVVDGVVYPVYVLATDIKNFWVYYYCDAKPDGSRNEAVYVLTQYRVVSAALRAYFSEVLADNDIGEENLIDIAQYKGCGYNWLP